MAKSSDELHWRETYFILFPHDRRPMLDQVASALRGASARFELKNLAANDEGLLESLLVESSEDHAAVEISYEVGDAVVEQNLEWAKQLQTDLPADQVQQIITSDARLDVAHFERIAAGSADPASRLDEGFGEEEDALEMLDPTCLLTVVDALSQLTDGLTLDLASGEVIS